LDSVKKLINIWSSRGLSVYGKVTIIKSFLIPKFVYVCSVLSTPKELVKELNQLLFKFLWNGTDKVTRVSAINKYGKEIRIDKRPLFYKNYFEAGVICIQDLLFDLNINEAFSHWSDKIVCIFADQCTT